MLCESWGRRRAIRSSRLSVDRRERWSDACNRWMCERNNCAWQRESCWRRRTDELKHRGDKRRQQHASEYSRLLFDVSAFLCSAKKKKKRKRVDRRRREKGFTSIVIRTQPFEDFALIFDLANIVFQHACQRSKNRLCSLFQQTLRTRERE